MKRIFIGILTLITAMSLILGTALIASADESAYLTAADDDGVEVEIFPTEEEADKRYSDLPGVKGVADSQTGGDNSQKAAEGGELSQEGVDNSHNGVDNSQIGADNSHNGADNSQSGVNNSQIDVENPPESVEDYPDGAGKDSEGGKYEENLFEEIYSLIELNADKIFSVLAFIGTLIVSVGYKSGLLPLLRDALSKLKGAIDGVKSEGELTKAETDKKLECISTTVNEISDELSRIRAGYEDCEQLCMDREAMRIIIQGQIDMLYAIFMSSALPQYQKDEVGERIKQMREELKSYEPSKEN